MKKDNLKHSDCRNFVPVDVAKGICCKKNELIFIDTPICAKFECLPKCKFCDNFTSGDKNIGKCNGFKAEDWTYEDLRACNCESFKAKAGENSKAN